MRTSPRVPTISQGVAVIAVASAVCCATAAPAAGWRDRVEQAKRGFQAVTQQEVESARDQVRQAMGSVEEFFGHNRAKAAGWKAFTLWDDQLAQLAGAAPGELGFWERVLLRELQNAPGLEHPSLRRHRDAVRELIDAIAAAQQKDLQGEFEKTLSELAAILPQGDQGLSLEQAERITPLTTRLHHQKQAAGLVQAIRRQYASPNLEISIPAGFLGRLGNGSLDSDFGVNDQINGARVTGSGRLTGIREFELREDSQRGLIGVKFSGTTDSVTIAHQDGVRVQTHSALRFASTSEVHVGPAGFEVQPFVTTAELSNRIQSIGTSYNGRRDSEARSRVYGRQEADRRQAQQRAIFRLNRAFEEELDGQIRPVQAYYEDQLRNPLLRHDTFPDEVQVTSSRSHLLIRADCAASYQLPAQTPPPPCGTDAELKFAIHQSALNHTLSAFLAAQTMPLRQTVRRTLLFDSEPEQAAGTGDAAEPHITFSDSRPCHVSFDGGEIALVLCGTAYQQGDQRYAGMDLQLRFRPEQQGGKWWLVQTAPPEVLLPRLPDGTRPQLGIRDHALRRILINVITRDVPPRTELVAGKLPPPLDQLGPIVTSSVLVRDGWFCLAAKEGA